VRRPARERRRIPGQRHRLRLPHRSPVLNVGLERTGRPPTLRPETTRGAVTAKRRDRTHEREEDAAELFRSLYPRLAGWCRRLVDDDGTAHEIAAEAFTRLWARWTKVDEPTGFLYVTAANLVRDHWRKTERERRALRFAGRREAERQTVDGDDPSVRLLVTSLPERLRDPVLLYYFADLPVREVAARLGRSEGTVKSDLHTARELLRATLGGSHDRIR
jgi:RNA polymerase sigma-70 factor (ECF subfamily)